MIFAIKIICTVLFAYCMYKSLKYKTEQNTQESIYWLLYAIIMQITVHAL